MRANGKEVRQRSEDLIGNRFKIVNITPGNRYMLETNIIQDVITKKYYESITLEEDGTYKLGKEFK